MAIKQNNFTKISLMLATGLSLFLFVKLRQSQKKLDKFVVKTNSEQQLLQTQFDEILKKYDSLHFLNNSAFFELDNPNSEENIISTDSNISVDSKPISLDSKIEDLKEKIEGDVEKVKKINASIQANKNKLIELERIRKNSLFTKANRLSTSNLNVRGVKILSDIYKRNSKKQIEQVRVCFTLNQNEFVPKGEKKIYIQLVNPRNQIVSAHNTYLEKNNEKLIYSEVTEVLFNQEDTDVCAYVDLEKNKTVKGKYQVNLYYDYNKIGTTIFEYN